jgi:hypothetical protein
MNPEQLKNLAIELGNVMNNNAGAPSYIVVWVFWLCLRS